MLSVKRTVKTSKLSWLQWKCFRMITSEIYGIRFSLAWQFSFLSYRAHVSGGGGRRKILLAIMQAPYKFYCKGGGDFQDQNLGLAHFRTQNHTAERRPHSTLLLEKCPESVYISISLCNLLSFFAGFKIIIQEAEIGAVDHLHLYHRK